jgi:hypothetical protein
MQATFIQSAVFVFGLLCVQWVALTFKIDGGVLQFGLVIGALFGTVLGVSATNAAHSWDRRKERQQLDRLLHEHLLSPKEVYKPDPLAIEALWRLTDKAVLGGFCCYCGSDHEGLKVSPFAPKFHRANPLCPVPLSRKIYEDNYVECGQKIRKSHAVLIGKQTARIASSIKKYNGN